MSSGADSAKVMAKIAVIGLIAAVVIAGFPVIFTIAERNNPGDQSALLFLVTLPIGAIIGLPALGLAIVVSIIGISRAWRTSTVHRVMAIIAIVLMLLSTVFILAMIQSWKGPLVALLPLLGFAGFVIFVITGFTGLDKKAAVDRSAG